MTAAPTAEQPEAKQDEAFCRDLAEALKFSETWSRGLLRWLIFENSKTLPLFLANAPWLLRLRIFPTALMHSELQTFLLTHKTVLAHGASVEDLVKAVWFALSASPHLSFACCFFVSSI